MLTNKKYNNNSVDAITILAEMDEQLLFTLSSLTQMAQKLAAQQVRSLTRENGELKSKHAKLRRLADIDRMTGLLNKGSFQTQIKRQFQLAKTQQSPLSVILIDVDYFKQYNDRLGHLKGDVALTQLGKILTKSLFRLKDKVIARFGGEEFVVILPRMTLTKAAKVAEYIRKQVELAVFDGQTQLPEKNFTISLGVATLKQEDSIATE